MTSLLTEPKAQVDHRPPPAPGTFRNRCGTTGCSPFNKSQHDPLRPEPAPCHYWHLKLHALNGGRTTLSERDLTFVGVGLSRVGLSRVSSDGWRQPDGLYVDAEDVELSAFAKAARALGVSLLDVPRLSAGSAHGSRRLLDLVHKFGDREER